MKKIFYSVLAVATMLLSTTSCSQDEIVDITKVEGQEVNYTVQIPGTAQSRAINPYNVNVGEGKLATKLIYALYENGAHEKGILKAGFVDDAPTTGETPDGKFNVSLTLAKNINYDILFMAYNPDNCAFIMDNATAINNNLKALTIDMDNLKANQEQYDAFVGRLVNQNIHSASNHVDLKRPFAQVNAATTAEELADVAELKTEITKSKVVIYSAPTTLNIFDNSVSGSEKLTYGAEAILTKYGKTVYPTNEDIVVNGQNFKYLAMAYVLADKDGSTHDAEFTFYRSDNRDVSDLTVTGMPIQANFRTNIVGTLLTQQENYDIIIDAKFDRPAFDETGAKVVENQSDLQTVIEEAEAGENIVIKLGTDITLTEPLEIPVDKNIVIDLAGSNLTIEDAATKYAIMNLGQLTLKDSSVASRNTKTSSPSISARGIYNGYYVDADGNSTVNNQAKITIESGTYNAMGENGGAAVFNYGIAEIKGGTFTSKGGYSLNNQKGSSMTITDAIVTGGIYNEGNSLAISNGKISTNRGGYTHAIYHNGGTLTIDGGEFQGNGNEVINANSAEAIINGGTFTKVEKTSYLMAGSNMTINGGTFYAHSSNPAGHPVRPDVTVKGGTFNYEHKNIAEGYMILKTGNDTWMVVGNDNATLEHGAVLNLGGVEYNGTITAKGDLTIKGDTKIKTLKAINGGIITIEEGKTLTLNNFSFGAKENASAEYEIKGGTVVANYGFFQHGTYKLYSNFSTGYMYYSYGSDITVYGTFHSQGNGDGLDYVRGKLTIAKGGKSIHDKSLWVGQPSSWGAMNASLIIEDGGYVQANSLSVYEGSSLTYSNDEDLKYNSVTGTEYITKK